MKEETISTIAGFVLLITVILIILLGCTSTNPATTSNRNGTEFHKIVKTTKQ